MYRRFVIARAVRTAGTPVVSNTSLLSAAAIVGASLLASRLLGLVRQTVFAALFGTGPDMAAYAAAFRIPDLLFTLVAGGALASAFVPVFAGLLEQRREVEAWQIANTVLNSLFAVLTIAAALAFLLAPQLTALLVPGFSGAERAETADLTRIMLVQPVLLGVAGLFTAMQQSYGRFLLPALGPICYNVSIILGALIFGPHFGVYAAAWAVTIGALALFEVQLPGLIDEFHHFRLRIDWQLRGAREVLRMLGPRVIGLTAYQVMLLVTTYLASGLSATAFNAITYSWVLVMLPVNAFGSSVATAVFPTVSRQAAVAQHEAMIRTIRESLRSIVFFVLPSMAGLIILRRPIIDLLYHHGRWTAHSTEATAFALAFYALGLVPMTLLELMPRAFYALKDTRTPVVIGVTALLLDAVLSVIFIHVFPKDQGQGGLALATAISVWVQGVWLYWALDRRLPGIVDAPFRQALGAMMLAAVLMCLVLFVVLRVVGSVVNVSSTFGAFVIVVLTVGAGAATYLGVARAFGLPEIHRLRALVKR